MFLARWTYCRLENCSVDTVVCQGRFDYSSSNVLEIVNSTIDTLYAYDISNITITDSVINTLITDPVDVKLVNSIIMNVMDLSCEIRTEDENPIVWFFADTFNPPLPSDVQTLSKYSNITILDNSHLDAQVKTTYDEAQLQAAGVGETALRMYCLDQSGMWQLCPIQGVNTVNNYVWSNTTLTGKSYFVVGGQPGIAGDINTDGIVDIFDIVIVALEFGHPPPPIVDLRADVNKDGLVDIFDIVVVALHFGEIG